MKKLINFILPGVGEFFIEKDKDSLAHSDPQAILEKDGKYTIYHRDLIIYFTPWDHKHALTIEDIEAIQSIQLLTKDEPKRPLEPIILDL